MWLFPCPRVNAGLLGTLSPCPGTFRRVGHHMSLPLRVSPLQDPSATRAGSVTLAHWRITGACHLARRGAVIKTCHTKGSLTDYQYFSCYNTDTGSGTENAKIPKAGETRRRHGLRGEGRWCLLRAYISIPETFRWEKDGDALPLALHGYLFPLPPTPQLILLY